MLKMTTETPAQIFETCEKAQFARQQMRGWIGTRIVHTWTTDDQGYPTIPAWMIEVPGHGYLRENGYVN